jgi:hypothetical protein
MALNSSGPLSFGGATTGQSINLELGFSATALASINSASFRTLAGVASGQISVSNFYGKSNAVGNISYVGTNVNVLNQAGSSGVNSSGDFWALNDAIQNGTFGKTMLQKWNSSNVWQSSRLYNFSGTSPMTQVLYVSAPGGRQVVGFDGNLYIDGDQGGTQNSRNLTGKVFIKWDSSGTFVWGKNYYYYTDNYNGASTLNIGMFGYGASVNAAGTNYFGLGLGIVYLSGFDCCGNPLYDSATFRGIASADSSGNLGAIYEQANVPSTAGQAATMYTLTTSGSTNYFCTSMQVPSLGGFVTRVSQRTGAASSCNWSYAFYASIPVLGQSGYIQNNSGGSCVIDSAGDLILVDFNNYRLMKVNSSGTYQWGRQYQFTNFSFENVSKSVAVDSSNNIYICGEANNYYLDATYPRRVVVLKINSSGTLQWARVISSLTTPTVTGINRAIRFPSAQIRGSDILITFGTQGGVSASGYRGAMTVTYPQSGSFTGDVTVPFSGGYYTINIASFTVTTYEWVFGNRSTQSNSLSSFPYSLSTVSLSSSVETLTATPTLVSF